jgi:hypothetical protein
MGNMGARERKITMRTTTRRRACCRLRSVTLFGEKIHINQPKVVRREEW